MSALTPHHVHFTPAQLDIIKKTCAPDTNHDEFNLFIEAAKGYGLNPMRRQIMAMVFSKDKPDKRRMSLIVEIGGLRAIAGRSGRYRPASEPTVFEYGAENTDTNPLGLSRALVTVFKQDDRGEWFPVVGEAWWDEHVNTTDEWGAGADGRRRPTGKKTLADTWQRMPKLMLAKCAEAQALRKGWPEDLGGLYEQAESGGAFDVDMLPSQLLEAHQIDKRQARVGKRAGEYAIQFGMGEAIEMIPPGQMHDRIAAYVRGLETVMEVKDFRARNALALRRYWADDADAALSLNKQMEARETAIAAEAQAETA
jgi:phage recombination protein Bet